MGLFSRLLDTDDSGPRHSRPPPPSARGHLSSTDGQAIERYRYMIKTAPPETIEQAHTEAFERLTPEQRRQVVRALGRVTPPEERLTLSTTANDDARGLARVATRAEIREPGVMERTLGQPGLGFGAGLLSSFAAGFVGSLAAQSFISALGANAGGAADDAAADEVLAAGPEDAADPLDPGAEHDLIGDDGSFDLSDFEI